MMNERQRVASKALNEAVVNMQNAYEVEGSTGDWAVIVADIAFDDDGDVTSGYSVYYNNGSTPTHVAMGLFRIGLDIASEGIVHDID